MKWSWLGIVCLMPAVACAKDASMTRDGEHETGEQSQTQQSQGSGGQSILPGLAAAGAIESVSAIAEVAPNRGDLSVRLPLPELPSRAGLVPNFDIVYGSTQADSGEGLGAGFGLSIPSVQATTDWGVPMRQKVDLTGGDWTVRLALGGERLVWVGADAVNGKARVQYRLEKGEELVRVYRYPEGGSISVLNADGTAGQLAFKGFVAIYPDGHQEVYSEDPAIAEGTMLASQIFFVTRWPLIASIAPTGDTVTYAYTTADDGRAYLKSATFAGGRSTYAFEIAPRPRGRVDYSMGYGRGADYLYTKMTASFDGAPMHTWYMAYAVYGDNAPTLLTHSDVAPLASADFNDDIQSLGSALVARDKLLGLYRFGRTSAGQKPLLRFQYSSWNPSTIANHALVYDVPMPGVYGFGPEGGSEFADVNFDGLVDVLRYSPADGTSFTSYGAGDLSSATPFVAEGALALTQVVAGTSHTVVPHFDASVNATSFFLSGDFNGDGRQDLLELSRPAVNDGSTQASLFAGQRAPGKPAFAASVATSSIKNLTLDPMLGGRVRVVDLNLDGKDDLLVAQAGAPDATFTALVNVTGPADAAPSFGVLSGLKFPFTPGADWALSASKFRFIDINRDGLPDLAVLRTVTGSVNGLCVYENQGGMTAYSSGGDQRVKLNKGALLFGNATLLDPTCQNGYFMPAPDMDTTQVNAMWIIDVNDDGFGDLVTLTPTADGVEARFGRPDRKFTSKQVIPLQAGVSVDPQNPWNTRVVDIDGDGVDEIVIYESGTNGGRLRVVDFNREMSKNLIGPDLLIGFSEGPGLVHAFQYGTSTDELVRDRKAQGGAVELVARGIPSPVPVIKRELQQVGGAAPRVTEYQYHGAYFDEVERGFLGFANVETLEYGEPGQDTGASRLSFQLTGAVSDRLLANQLSHKETFAPKLTTTQAQRIAGTGAPWGNRIEDASYTAEAWAEEPLVTQSTIGTHDEQWAAVPAGAGKSWFIRETASADVRCGSQDCSAPSRVTHAYAYDPIPASATNQLVSDVVEVSAVTGPQGTALPARGHTKTLSYDPSWQQRGVLTAVSEEKVQVSATGEVLSDATTAFRTDVPLPTTTMTQVLLDADARASLPPYASTALGVANGGPAALAPRSVMYAYDAFGNVIDVSDSIGVRSHRTYDASGVRLLAERNALGHTTQYCYGLSGCTLSDPGVTSIAPIPPQTLAPTHTLSPQGVLTLSEYDDRHRPIRTSNSMGGEVSYSYKDAAAVVPALVRVSQRWYADGQPGGARKEHLVAVRADGTIAAEASQAEASGVVRVLSYTILNREGRAAFDADPFTASGEIPALFAAGTFPTPVTAACASGTGSCATYDAAGRVSTVMDAPGTSIVHSTYEAWGRQTDEQLLGPNGANHTRIEVARDEGVYAVVDESGAVHSFDRDERGAIRRIRMAGESAPRLIAYDSAGEIVATVVPHGLTRAWELDARGRRQSEVTFDSAGAAWERVDRTFDALDRVAHVGSSSSSRPSGFDDVAYGYDGDGTDPSLLGRLVQVKAVDLLIGQSVAEAFQYDRAGLPRARHVTYSGADVQKDYEEQWGYALDGSLGQVRDSFGNRFDLTSGASSLVTDIRWTAPGQTTSTPLIGGIQYSSRGALAAYAVAPSMVQRSFDHDAASGQLTGLRACIGQAAAACASLQNVQLERRGDGRLVSSQGTNAATTRYAYSSRGELVSTQNDSQTTAYAYGSSGQVAQLRGAPFVGEIGSALPTLPQGRNYQLDTFGRVVAGGPFAQAEYDPQGRLRRTTVLGKTIAYSYSAFGERASKRVQPGDGSPERVVLYPSPTTRDDGAERQSIVRLADRRLAVVINEQNVLSLLDDQLGVTTGAVDNGGQVVASFEYDPYGTPIHSNVGSGIGSTELVFSFTGQLTDPDTGLVHMGAREYAPELASFLTPDPYVMSTPEHCTHSVLECQLYSYVAHDPVSFVDESGLMLSGRPTYAHVVTGAHAAGLVLWHSASASSHAQARAPQSAARPATPPATEVYFRSMSEAHADTLFDTSQLLPTRETFISPTQGFAANYDGVLVRFELQSGTTDRLASIGVRDSSRLTAAEYPNMPRVFRGWTVDNAFFKAERGQINIGLGQGRGIDEFNRGIVTFDEITQ